MMVILFTIGALLIGASTAALQGPEPRFIVPSIVAQINEIQQLIRDNGLDPYIIEKEEFELRPPVTDLFFIEAKLEELLLTGLSDIKIVNINYSILASRLRFDLYLPKVSFYLGSAQAAIGLGRNEFRGYIGGSVDVKEIRVAGEVRVYVGIISGISIRSITINFTVRDIQSDLRLVVLNRDLSGFVNYALENVVTSFLEENRNDINKLLEYYVRQIVEANL